MQIYCFLTRLELCVLYCVANRDLTLVNRVATDTAVSKDRQAIRTPWRSLSRQSSTFDTFWAGPLEHQRLLLLFYSHLVSELVFTL